MRYVGLIVGIAMIVIGVLVEIASVIFFTGFGSFECSASECDFLGPWPFLLGGGILLIIVGFFVLSFALSAMAVRGGVQQAQRWTRLARMNRFGTFGNRSSSRVMSSWHVSTHGEDHIPAEMGPMVEGILSGLRASGLIPPDAGHPTVLDPATGQPIPAAFPPDGRTDAERAPHDLRASGTLGRVTVHGIRPLPAPTPGGQLVELQLEVAPEDRQPYRLRHFAVVPQPVVHRVAVGAGFPVWVDPADPSRLLIDWERD